MLQLQRLNMEASSFAGERAPQLKQKAKEYKADLAKLREDARISAASVPGTTLSCPSCPQLESSLYHMHQNFLSALMMGIVPTGGAAARAELGLAEDYYTTSAGQRERLLKTTDMLGKTSERIQAGRAQLHETEVRSMQPLCPILSYLTLNV